MAFRRPLAVQEKNFPNSREIVAKPLPADPQPGHT
ncbi:hypothetical protein SFR_3564 [Streptomyces sp. FR-008]|nr:hypothetical protein SFR_3564 [Streptomyces sp. FR-008]